MMRRLRLIGPIVSRPATRDNSYMVKTDMTIRNASDNDEKLWDGLAAHPLQSWAWGAFRKAMGIDVVRLVEEKNNKPRSVWQLTFHAIPHTPWTVGFFPKGPMPSQHMIDALRRIGQEKNAIFIQLEPNTTVNFKLLRLSHHPLFTKYTYLLDLTKSETELLAAMHTKTRYNLRVAERHGVVIKKDSSNRAFDAYLRLNQETTSRQGFYAHNETYHRTMWRVLSAANIAHLFTASYKDEILAAWIVFAWGDTVYYPYGASGREHREVMAPTLMLWEITKWAKSAGYKTFDLWGALGPNPDPHDPWFGFHRFKQGFNPELIKFTGSYDLVIHPFLYRLYTFADRLRWTLLKLKAR